MKWCTNAKNEESWYEFYKFDISNKNSKGKKNMAFWQAVLYRWNCLDEPVLMSGSEPLYRLRLAFMRDRRIVEIISLIFKSSSTIHHSSPIMQFHSACHCCCNVQFMLQANIFYSKLSQVPSSTKGFESGRWKITSDLWV